MQPESDTTIDVASLTAGLKSLPGLVSRVAALEGEIARLRAENRPRAAKWYKLGEVMEILKVSRDTVEDYIKGGRLKKSTLSRHVRIAAEEVDNFRGVACL